MLALPFVWNDLHFFIFKFLFWTDMYKHKIVHIYRLVCDSLVHVYIEQYFIIFTFTHMCIHFVGHLTPLPQKLFFFFVVLGFELGASPLLSRRSATWATPPAQNDLH
jgi:hypothetical protein